MGLRTSERNEVRVSFGREEKRGWVGLNGWKFETLVLTTSTPSPPLSSAAAEQSHKGC